MDVQINISVLRNVLDKDTFLLDIPVFNSPIGT